MPLRKGRNVFHTIPADGDKYQEECRSSGGKLQGAWSKPAQKACLTAGSHLKIATSEPLCPFDVSLLCRHYLDFFGISGLSFLAEGSSAAAHLPTWVSPQSCGMDGPGHPAEWSPTNQTFCILAGKREGRSRADLSIYHMPALLHSWFLIIFSRHPLSDTRFTPILQWGNIIWIPTNPAPKIQIQICLIPQLIL